ncbi:MAG: rod shape-determining protein RodA [Flavobacteriales bacterium]|nr:rod shape-determining protein RodA [Flavobacteriales bacterium]|tara:strand:- start:7308 stop:7745 length:438 start_codon:yes stop_codon:yes gene_type:complete
MKNILLSCLFVCVISCSQKPISKTSEPQKTVFNTNSNKVFFKNISNGDTLDSPFVVEMGVVGMKIKPAGPLETGTGHHHIIIDKKHIDYGNIIPMDETHLHYGKGDSIATISLPSGDHTLTLQFANGVHMSYGEQYSNTITIYVK